MFSNAFQHTKIEGNLFSEVDVIGALLAELPLKVARAHELAKKESRLFPLNEEPGKNQPVHGINQQRASIWSNNKQSTNKGNTQEKNGWPCSWLLITTPYNLFQVKTMYMQILYPENLLKASPQAQNR